VVLTLPTQSTYRDVAERAVGELARRHGFETRQWRELEAAVSRAHTLLGDSGGDRIRFTFEATEAAIIVEAQVTPLGSVHEPGQQAIGSEAVDDFRAAVDELVEDTEVDVGAGRVRFSKSRQSVP
jgi:hypothetical protein